MEKLIEAIMLACVAVLGYLLLVMFPVSLYADAECLRSGYPKSHVTVGLERYCSNFDGAVTVRVTKQ